MPQTRVVSTPPSPTGQVFNFTPSFLLPTGGKALFIFDTLSGAIAAWNGAQGTTAVTEVTSTNTYTRLAIGNNGTADWLWAADFSKGTIDTFDGSFMPISSSGGFTDPSCPWDIRPTTSRQSAANCRSNMPTWPP